MTLGVSDGQGGLSCCGSRGRKESDRTDVEAETPVFWPPDVKS